MIAIIKFIRAVTSAILAISCLSFLLPFFLLTVFTPFSFDDLSITLLFVEVNTFCKLFYLFVLLFSTFCNIVFLKGGNNIMSEDKYKQIFSQNLRYYMSLNNKEQIDLINDLGFNKSAVSTWCNGTLSLIHI